MNNTSKIDNKKVNNSNNINNTKEKAGTKTKNGKENNIQKNVVKEDDKKETKQIETQQKITYKDGIYIGSSEGKNGEIKVKVTVKDGRIHNIEILSHSDTENLFEIVYKKIISAVYEKQSAEVEIVSGATLTSNGLIRAISNALEGANNSK
ncbi:FMN-binding protein [Caloramator sp. Dgby_cultured_2]|uniref:FMN-binding protein n=1 Tax=Caloramator sp. Dgby_cultured_2 TaxID=3029174 RepID=UPI00406C45B6